MKWTERCDLVQRLTALNNFPQTDNAYLIVELFRMGPPTEKLPITMRVVRDVKHRFEAKPTKEHSTG